MEYGTFIFSAVTLLVAMVNNNLSMKLFNICGILAILTLIIKGRSSNLTWKSFALPASILFIGIIDLIWYKLFKVNNSSKINVLCLTFWEDYTIFYYWNKSEFIF